MVGRRSAARGDECWPLAAAIGVHVGLVSSSRVAHYIAIGIVTGGGGTTRLATARERKAAICAAALQRTAGRRGSGLTDEDDRAAGCAERPEASNRERNRRPAASPTISAGVSMHSLKMGAQQVCHQESARFFSFCRNPHCSQRVRARHQCGISLRSLRRTHLAITKGQGQGQGQGQGPRTWPSQHLQTQRA